MATETQIPEFVCLKSCETEDKAWSSELPGNKVKQLETVNTEVETGKLTNESGTFLQALSDPMVNAGQHSKIPESCEATTIQDQEEKKITEAVSTETEAGKEETIENEEKKATDRNGVTRSQDAVSEDIIKETMDGQDAATEFLKEETEDKVIDAQKASEECEIGAKEKEEEKPEVEEEIAEIRPSVGIEEKLDEKEEKTDSPLIKEVTVPEKAENQQEVNILEKEQCQKDATFAQDVTLEKGSQDNTEDNEQQVVKAKESAEEETEEMRNIIENPEQIDVIPTDVYISTLTEPVQETTKNEETEDNSIDAQEASKQHEDGTNNKGEEKPVDKIVESCLKLEQEEYTEEIKPTVEKFEESQVEDDKHVEDATFEDVKETLDGQDASIVADFKEHDLNEEPREFLLEETEDKLTHVQEASEECENEQKPEDSVTKSEKEEENAEMRPIVEETGLEKAENHEIVSKNEDEEMEQEQDVNAVTEEIIGEEAKLDAEYQADKTQDKIEMKDEVISTEKASEECETGAKEKEEEKPEKIEQEEEIAEIGPTVEVEEKLDEKSDSPLVKEVTVSEVVILKKDDEDQEKVQEINILEKEQGERNTTFAQDVTLEKGLQDHSEDNEQTKESIEEETEEIRNIIEKPEQINEEPKQENKEAEDKSIDAQEASEQYEDGKNNKGEQKPDDKIVESCLKLENEEYTEEIKPTVETNEDPQVQTAELEEEVNVSQKENLSIKEVSEEGNTKTESFTEAKSNDDEQATFEDVKETMDSQDATIVADFKEKDLNEESRVEETEDKLTHVQEATEECENESKEKGQQKPEDSVKKSEKGEEIAEIGPIVEESGSEKAENQQVVNMLEKDEDEEKEQEVYILEKDQDVACAQDVNPTDVCISTQLQLKEETTEIEENNDEEVIDGQTNKSEIPLVKELCKKELNEDEIVSKNEDEEKEQLLTSEDGGNDVTSSQNEDISIDAQETTEQYEDEANNKEEEEIGVNKIVDSCSKVEQEKYTEELKPSVEESTDLVKETIESDGGQKENPSIKEETESENIKSETVDISDNLSKDKDEEKEQELNMSEQNQEEDNVTCSEIKQEAIEIGEKNDDDQEISEIPLVNKTTSSEKVDFEQVTEQSDSFATDLESNEIVKKEENLEGEQEQDVNVVTEELIKGKLVDAQEMSSELQQPREENIEEIQTCLAETMSEKTETKTGQDLSHEKIEDINDNNTEEEKMVLDGRTREIEISTLKHEPVEEQKCGLDEVSKENLTDLNETIAVEPPQEDIMVSNSLETSTEDAPIDDLKSVSEVQIPQVVPTSEECVIADTTVHVDEEKENVKEEISSDDNVPENLLIKDVSEEIESKSERVELSDSLSKDKDVTSIEDLQTKNDDTEPELVETRESVGEEIKSGVEIEENTETKPSEEITEIGEKNDGEQKKSETSSEKAEFEQLTEHSDTFDTKLDVNEIVSKEVKEHEQNVNVTSEEKDKSEQKPDNTVNEPVNSCPEIVEENIKEEAGANKEMEAKVDAENQADKTQDKIEMKDEVISTDKMSSELEQPNEEKEEKISTLDHEPETTAIEPQEDITVSDSLETSTKDTFNSDSAITESESLPVDDAESVSEVVPTSDESNLKEECLISETTGRVDEEKETETESDEKTEIKQESFTEVCEETSLEKAESEGLELSDSSNVEQQGLLYVITSSAPTESKEETTENEEKSEDIENDGQINKAKIPLADQVCEVTSLEVEDRSIDAQECESATDDQREQIPEESAVEENFKENEADAGDNKEIKAKLDAENQSDRTQDTSDIKDDVISAQKMSPELERPNEENVIGDRTFYVTKIEEEEEKISTLDHEPETTAAEPQEDIRVSDSLETSTEDTFSSDKVKTESESLPKDDVESVSEVVPTSDESNLEEDCLISETTGRVIEETETVTESDDKTEIKQETSLEKAELEGLKLSDVEKQGLLDAITSSEPTESKEEKSEDIENDGQIKKAEIPLVEQVCEVTNLEVEDRSIEIPEESVEENEADAGDKTQDTSEIKDEVISMLAELEQPKEENVEAEIITEKTEDTITKNDDQEKIEDTNDNNTTEEEKIVLDEKTREFEISEHVEEQNCFDQVSKENFTDLNETAAVENTSNSDKEKTESESLSTNDLETVSEVQIPKVGPVSEVSNQKEECLVSATADVTEHVEKDLQEDTGDHNLEDPETENSCPATQETSEPDETETKLDAENQVERTEGSEIKDEVITAEKVDEEIHACLTATKSESTEDKITKEDEEKCIVDGKAREIEISAIEQEPVEEKNSGVDEVLTETAAETQEDITVSDSLETSTKDTLDSEKAKTESENSQKDDLEEQIPEVVVPALEESKDNKEYHISETATHVVEEKETVTLSDETTEIMQETSAGLEEFVKTKESVDEDTKEIKSSVETNEIESESPLIKEVCEPKDSDSFNTKLDENEIVNKTTEATIEILGEETEDKSYDAQEASEDIANDEIEQKPVENVIEENVKEDAEKKKDIEAKLDDKTEDRSEMKDEAVTTEKIEDEITEKDDNLENAYENTTKGELEHEPVVEQNGDLDEEKLTDLNENTAVEPTLPIKDVESVSQVQIPETVPKVEDSATTDYHINEENMPQVDSACEKTNIEEDVTQLKSTEDRREMVQDVILTDEIAYSDPVPAEVAVDAQIGQEGLKAAEDISCENDHVDEALISPSLEDVATTESQVKKLPTRALESICDVQTPEVIADSADPNEISSAPVKSDEEKNDLNKEDKALTIENLELHDELKPTSEVTIEEQVNELKPQQEQSEKNIINDPTLESKLEQKDFEDGKEDIVTLAPEKQNEIMKNVILTNEIEQVVVETENEKGGNEVKEDNSPTELEYTLTTNQKELENEVPNFEFEKKEKDDELISQVQTPESILKMEMKEEATNDTCEMVLLEDEKENISINEEAIHNQLPSDTNEVFQIEKLNSSRNETTEDPKSIAENLKLEDETFTDMKRSDEDSETVAAEVEILENIVTEEKIVKTDANKEKETLDEPHEDEAENLPEASIEKHDPEIKTKSEVAEIVPGDRESCSILTENLPEASKEITTTEKIEKEIENKERGVQESSAQNDKKIEDSLFQPSIEKEIIQDVVRNEEIEQPNLDKTFEFVNQEAQKEQADENMIPVEDVKSSTREFEIPAVMEADYTEDLKNKTVEAEKGVINENESKPTEEVSGIKQEPLQLDAPVTLDTTATEDLKKYVTDDLLKTSQSQPEIQNNDVSTTTVDKQSPTEPQENENKLLTNQIDAKPLIAEVEDLKATEPQSEIIKEEKKLSDENKTSESEVVENLIGQRELTLPKDQLVEKEKSGVKSDEENEEEDDDNEDNEKMGSDAPVMVEASKDMEVKVHKKSHNILSGVGSKVKHSIAKVKKAITGGKSSPKSPSPPPKERDQVIT